MWDSLPSAAREFIYAHDLPLKVAHVNASLEFDLPEREVRVAGITERDGESLFVRSTRKGREWELPGGRLQENESPETAIQREFYEETGYEVTNAEPLLALVWVFEDSTIIHLVFAIEIGDQVSDPDSEEISELGWFESTPDAVSFGTAGAETYEVILNSSPVTVAFTDDDPSIEVTSKRSLAMGGAVAGGVLAAGVLRHLRTNQEDE